MVIYAATLIGIVARSTHRRGIGIVLSVGKLIYKVSRLDIRKVETESRTEIYLGGAATFINMPKLMSALESLPKGNDVHIHIKDLAYIDHACLDCISHWKEQHEASGSQLEIEWDGLLDRFARIGGARTGAPVRKSAAIQRA